MNQQSAIQKWASQMMQIFQDLNSNAKYKQSYIQVTQIINLLSSQLQWTANNNSKPGLINLQPNKIGLKQLFNKLNINDEYDKQKILIAKAYATRRSQEQNMPNPLTTNLLNQADMIESIQILLVHYANSIHVIRQSHEKHSFQLQKSHIVTAPLLNLNQTTLIVIQPYSNYSSNSTININQMSYQQLLNKLKLSEQHYYQLIDFKTKIYHDDIEYIGKINLLHHQFKYLLLQLLTPWQQHNATFRLAVLNQYNLSPQSPPNIFIYQPFQPFYSHKTSPLFNITFQSNQILSQNYSPLPNLILHIRLIKQLLLYQLISFKYQPIINHFNVFQKRLQTQFYQQLKQRQQKAQHEKERRISKIKNTNSLSNYQNLQIKSFFLDWNKSIKNKSSTKIAYLSIDLNSMYLVTDYKYIKMKCELFISYLDKRNKQNKSTIETKYFKFLFDKNNDDWNVKLVPEDNKSPMRNVIFDLSKVSDFFNLQVKITPQGKNGIINGSSTISKRQKLNGFGQNEQLVLSQSGKMGNERTVGFLKLFYLIQQSYDIKKAQSFDLKKYRSIKVLQLMPRMPANYFEETLINYNPNEMRLYSQIVGYGNEGVSRINFQKVYLKMIEFLEEERMDQRRENMIMIENKNMFREEEGKRKQKVFLSHQRVRQYEKIMRVNLVKQIVSSFKGLQHTHWMDAQSKIINSEPMKSDQFSSNDLIQQFSLIIINDQLPTKTSILVNQQLKYTMYQSQILFVNKPHAQTMGVIGIILGLNNYSADQYLGQVYRSNNNSYSKCRRVRISQCANRLQQSFTIQAYNPFLVPLINRLITLFKHNQLQETDYRSSSLQRQSITMSTTYHQPIDISRLTTFIINFIRKVYPYHQPKYLQQQLMCVRYFVMKYLPQVSYQLNRNNIGLQNLVSKYLLSLFTIDLEEELTFQIWDFIILANNKFAARINSILTLLIFMEKNNFSPLIPLDAFVTALKQNYNKFDLSFNAKKVSELMISSLGEFYQKQHKRKAELCKMRNSNGSLLVGDEFVKRVLFDTQRQNRVSYQKNKVNLNDLSYKLPQPKYYGYPVQQVQLLIKSFVLLQTVSVQNWRMSIRWHNQCSIISIVEKSQILNSYIRFDYPKYLSQNFHEMPNLQFILSPKQQVQQERYFIGCFQMIGLHKNNVYCQQVKMLYVRNGEIIQNNKGENVINVQIILKSNSSNNNKPSKNINNNNRTGTSMIMNNNTNSLHNSRSSTLMKPPPQTNISSHNTLNLQKQYYLLTQSTQQRIYSSLLDYDISEQNDFLKSITQLRRQLTKMKNPIDQFTKQKYKQVRITHLGDNTFPEIVMNSKLLIQQLQSLIECFNDDKMRTILPTLYKLYSQPTNYQMVFLTEILIEALLIDNTIYFQTKIQYLYLIGKHYQNCNSKGLTSQTTDFIFKYIYKTYGWLNPVPYTKQNKGAIIKALIYTKGIKNTDNTLDITQILQDAAYINKIKYGQYSIVLGNSQYLTQFRQLLPLETLQMIQQSNNNKEIKIQITYYKNYSRYLYTVNVNVKDFKITQQGGKFLSKYPLKKELNANKRYTHNQNCANINQLFYSTKTCHPQCGQSPIDLDTSSQILYNCNNIISLQSPQTLDKTSFRKAIYTTPMISYLLNYSSQFEPIRYNTIKKSIIPKPTVITNEQIQLKEYKDWVLYRYQYCQQEWRKCKVQKIDGDNVFVNFPPNQLKIQNNLKQLLSTKYNQNISSQIYCKAPSFQFWSMEENLVEYNDLQAEPTANQQFRTNQKTAMVKISSMYQSKG